MEEMRQEEIVREEKGFVKVVRHISVYVRESTVEGRSVLFWGEPDLPSSLKMRFTGRIGKEK